MYPSRYHQTTLNDEILNKAIEVLVSKVNTILHLIEHDCNCEEKSNDSRFMSTVCTLDPSDSKSTLSTTVSSEVVSNHELKVLSDNIEKILRLFHQKSTINLKRNLKNKYSNRRKIFRDIKKSYFPGAFLGYSTTAPKRMTSTEENLVEGDSVVTTRSIPLEEYSYPLAYGRRHGKSPRQKDEEQEKPSSVRVIEYGPDPNEGEEMKEYIL